LVDVKELLELERMRWIDEQYPAIPFYSPPRRTPGPLGG